jgi:hypothetical protein
MGKKEGRLGINVIMRNDEEKKRGEDARRAFLVSDNLILAAKSSKSSCFTEEVLRFSTSTTLEVY